MPSAEGHRAEPHAVLGVPRGAPRQEVKQAFRRLALRYHPDKDASKEAAARFAAIRQAADILLASGDTHYKSEAAAAAAAARRAWRAAGQPGPSQSWAFARGPKAPLIFCSACLLGGCALFAGALRVHQDMYTYNIATEAEERRKNPTEAQRRVLELLQEHRMQQRMRQPEHQP